MSTFLPPGASSGIYDAFTSFVGMVNTMLMGQLSPAQVADLKAEIENSVEITDDEAQILLGEFTEDKTAIPTGGAVATVTTGDWKKSFETFYRKNFLIISLAQWLILFIVLLKHSKTN